MAKYLITILVTISIFSVNCQKNTAKPSYDPDQIIIIDHESLNRWPDDSFYFSSEALIEDNSLRLNIAYSGGCANHTFRLLGLREFMETNPPTVPIFLSHNAHNDYCDGFMTDTLSFDLKPLEELYKYYYGEDSDMLYLSIDGLEQPIVYEMGPN
ncbi:MAG: hypothetical protein GY839_20355 [candidate division Zixibacteria bacterium]|nr:hypothetical protein [candidate division Zixibacteria bacterium]